MKKLYISYVIFSFSLAVLAAIEWSVIHDLWSKWLESGTYAHGFIIFPISLYIIYTKRATLLKMDPEPYAPGFILLIVLSICQLLFKIASVVVLEEFTLIAMLHAMVLGILGKKIYRYLLFPLMYLFFAVPFGHFLITTLQDITASFTAFALKLSGLTIYHDKWYISTTRGDFEVAAACSGVRYLIASIALCTIFSYYAYRSIKKRIYFILLSIILPIIANALRAYLIILIAHMTHMKMAVGIDHLIYGWIFFGIVIMGLFWVGMKYADPMPKPIESTPRSSSVYTLKKGLWQCSMIIPVLFMFMMSTEIFKNNVSINAHYDIDWDAAGWTLDENPTLNWHPIYHGTISSKLQRYRDDDKGYVDVYVGLYDHPTQGKEAVSSLNLAFDKHDWFLRKSTNHSLDAKQYHYTIAENQLHNLTNHQLVWQWYEILGVKTSHPAIAKGLEVLKRLVRSKEPTVVILMASSYQSDPTEARNKMKAFINEANLHVKENARL